MACSGSIGGSLGSFGGGKGCSIVCKQSLGEVSSAGGVVVAPKVSLCVREFLKLV